MAGRRRGAPPPLGRRRVAQFPSRVDRISALPDDLLLQVLTCLRCVRTAARTGLLARRWRRVWTGLLEVSFCRLAPDAIQAALARVTGTSLEAIDIHVSRGSGRRALDARSVTNLLHAAARRSPVKIALTIPVSLYNKVDLPRFDLATSIELTVRVVLFALPEAMEFPALETLSLSGCIMDLATLVPRCPLLRSLSVTRMPYEVDTITVHSASLQELVVSTFQFTLTIDIVATVLRKLTLDLSWGIGHSLSVVAPMVDKVTWRCFYYSMYVGIGKMWRVCSLKVRAVEKMELDDEEGSHQPHCAHVLSLDILEVQVTDPCDFWCPCQENNWSWRKTAISLMDFTEVQIKGFRGDDEEINFLKLLFRCAPALKTMTLKLSDEVTDDWYNAFLDTVQEYPYVNSSVCIG